MPGPVADLVYMLCALSKEPVWIGEGTECCLMGIQVPSTVGRVCLYLAQSASSELAVLRLTHWQIQCHVHNQLALCEHHCTFASHLTQDPAGVR